MATGFVPHLLAALMLISCITLPVAAQDTANTVTYSIVHLSDTQNLATYYPDTYNLTFSYLESEKTRYNISAIVITGDLVNTWDKKREWERYRSARNQTTIPVYVIAGNHDADYGNHYRYYSLYTGEPETSYLTTIGDFDFVGINYADKTLSPENFSFLRESLLNSTRSNAIIATHWYMDADRKRSLLGKDIDRTLIVKPTLILMGHKHADFVQQGTISGFPVVEDMTNYQNGVPGGNGDVNYSAGTLYTVTSAGGNVAKITSRIIHMYPNESVEREKTVFELPTAGVTPAGPVPTEGDGISLYHLPEECGALDLPCRFQHLIGQSRDVFGSVFGN